MIRLFIKTVRNISILVFFCLASIISQARNKDLSPIDFGLRQAKNGVERYECLYKTHCAAIEAGVNVSYKGIDSLNIEIPKAAKSIPLTENNDFGGLVLTVRNNSKTHFVFEMAQNATKIHLDKNLISSGDFSSVNLISKGYVVLVLADKTLWVKNRRGYNYGAERRDIIYLKDGKAQNTTVSSYETKASVPVVSFFIPSPVEKRIANITFIRERGNTMRANLMSITNQSGIVINNIKCETPASTLYADQIINVTDCANIRFKDITINGSYSQEKKSGYGISMNNVYNVSFLRLKGHANWGIFGNNNVNNIKLKQCDVNRFDVHCYGRDVFFEDCKFRNLYNQFSSMFGTVSFKKCEFFDFTPVQLELSYNAYTKFNLVFKKCIVHPSKQKNYLIYAGELIGAKTDEREELAIQQFPDLSINGLKIDMPNDMGVYYLYKFRSNIQIPHEIEGVKKIRKVRFSSNKAVRFEKVDVRT